MSSITEQLHRDLLDSLEGVLNSNSEISDKPLLVDLKLPAPPRLRVYLYSLVSATGTVRSHEYKIVLRVRGQPGSKYQEFDYSDGRFVVVAGYRRDLNVFVLWDASMHPRFKNGGNVQVRDSTVYEAVANGWAEQRRPLQGGRIELVISCRPSRLLDALNARLATTGGVIEES